MIRMPNPTPNATCVPNVAATTRSRIPDAGPYGSPPGRGPLRMSFFHDGLRAAGSTGPPQAISALQFPADCGEALHREVPLRGPNFVRAVPRLLEQVREVVHAPSGKAEVRKREPLDFA